MKNTEIKNESDHLRNQTLRFSEELKTTINNRDWSKLPDQIQQNNTTFILIEDSKDSEWKGIEALNSTTYEGTENQILSHRYNYESNGIPTQIWFTFELTKNAWKFENIYLWIDKKYANKAVDTTAANARLFDDEPLKSTNPDAETMAEAAVVSP